MTTSQTTATTHLSNSLNLTNQKKVLLLSRHNGQILLRLINIIQQVGCKVVLIGTALGYNYALKEKSYKDLGDRIETVYRYIADPPPILTITGVSQLVPFLEALDPDLVISYAFPYQLTGRFLAHRSIKINVHPSPLPLFKGNSAYTRAILLQRSTWAITWHYTRENYDTGDILIQEFFELQSPYGADDITSRCHNLVFETFGKAIEMSLSAHPGTPQRQPTVEEEQYIDAKPLTISERTIKSGLTCQEVWILVEACKYFHPALLNVDERLYQVIEARRLETPLPLTLAIGEVKRVLTRYVQQCQDGQMEYVVRVV